MKQKIANNRTAHQKLGVPARIALIASLVVISIFPLFVTFGPGEWPPQPMALVVDVFYLLVATGYVAVLTGRNRSLWLMATVSAISVIGVASIVWLAITLATLHITW